MRLKEQLVQQFGDRVRHLHRAVDLGFPEFTRHIRTLDSELAIALLQRYPTAAALRTVSVGRLARSCYDGSHNVGQELARALLEAAKHSVGAHHGEPYQLQVRYACEDLDVLRQRLRSLDRDVERRLEQNEVGKLLTTITGIGPQTAARIIAEVGDPARFHRARALASYVGVIPRVHQSGKRKFSSSANVPLGNARLRRALWMPALTAVKHNAWLHAYYQRLRTAGKTPQGGAGRYHPQIDDRSLQRRQASAAVCAFSYFLARCGRRGCSGYSVMVNEIRAFAAKFD